MTLRNNRISPVALLIGLFLVIAVQFVLATPIFEAPDEPYHFSFVNWLVRRGTLPNQLGRNGGAEQEGNQPPLFYVTASLVARVFGREGLDELRQHNPHTQMGSPEARINRNYALQHEPYPLQMGGARTAVYALRLLNVIFGAVTVWAVWKTARAAVPAHSEIAVLAAGLTALNPQFAFISGAVNNDMMSAMWGSLTLWQTVVMLRTGFTPRRSFILAVLVALASLTKVSGLLLGGVVGLAALLRLRRQVDWRGFFTLALMGLAVWIVVAGWWYARNLQLYGDFTGTSTMIRWVGARPPVPLSALIQELASLTMSYWGIFGWFNLLAPPLYYVIVDTVLIAAAAGVVYALAKSRRPYGSRDVWFLFAAAAVMALAALVVWTLTTYGTQGRLLFPFTAAISILIAFGLTSLRVPPRLILIPLGIFALAAPLAVVVAAYSPPAPVAALPETALPFYASWGQDVALVGHEPVKGEYRTGDDFEITLYWQPLQTSPHDNSLYLHLIAPDASLLGQVNTYPNGGLRRTSVWQPGIIYPDTYRIPVTVAGETPLRLEIGWYDPATGEALPAFDGNGHPAPFVILPVGSASP